MGRLFMTTGKRKLDLKFVTFLEVLVLCLLCILSIIFRTQFVVMGEAESVAIPALDYLCLRFSLPYLCTCIRPHVLPFPSQVNRPKIWYIPSF